MEQIYSTFWPLLDISSIYNQGAKYTIRKEVARVCNRQIYMFEVADCPSWFTEIRNCFHQNCVTSQCEEHCSTLPGDWRPKFLLYFDFYAFTELNAHCISSSNCGNERIYGYQYFHQFISEWTFQWAVICQIKGDFCQNYIDIIDGILIYSEWNLVVNIATSIVENNENFFNFFTCSIQSSSELLCALFRPSPPGVLCHFWLASWTAPWNWVELESLSHLSTSFQILVCIEQEK